MNSIRNYVAAALLAAGVLAAAATAVSSIASAADDVTAAAPPAGPDAGPYGRGHHGWGGPEHLFKKLNLTAEQQASIKSIMTSARPQMKTLHEQMHANSMKLWQTKPDDPNYATVVAETSQATGTLAAQRSTQMAELRAQMYAVLTPAQKAQLATLEAQMLAHPHQGRWGQHGPGPDEAPPPAE